MMYLTISQWNQYGDMVIIFQLKISNAYVRTSTWDDQDLKKKKYIYIYISFGGSESQVRNSILNMSPKSKGLTMRGFQWGFSLVEFMESPFNLTSCKLSPCTGRLLSYLQTPKQITNSQALPLESIVSWTIKMGNEINCKLKTIRPLIGITKSLASSNFVLMDQVSILHLDFQVSR